MSSVVLETLKNHQIQDKVFGLTSNNISNNKILADSLQQALADNVKIIQTPCLAHVIQLSLNQLLDWLKAVLQNNIAEIKQADRLLSLAKEDLQYQKHEVSYTFNKVRSLAIYIHGSPSRREVFNKLQTDNPKLTPIQDVRTRWNSTFLMLRRAKWLRNIFTQFCADYECEEILPDNKGWRQINYLLYITAPFFLYTTELSKTWEVTIYLVFKIYNALIEHLEKSIKQLQQKYIPWKKQMLDSLEAG